MSWWCPSCAAPRGRLTHLMITLDTTLLGWRPLDLDLGYSPFLENKASRNYMSDPVFQRKHMPAGKGRHWRRHRIRTRLPEPRPELEAVAAEPRELDGPILLKGIQSHATRDLPSSTTSTASLSRITADVRSTGRSCRWMRSVRSSRRSTAVPRALRLRDRTGRDAFKALRSAPTRCSSASVPVRPRAGRERGARRVMRSLVDELKRRSGRRVTHSPHALPFLPDPRALKEPRHVRHTRRQFLEVAAATAARLSSRRPARRAPVDPGAATPAPAKSRSLSARAPVRQLQSEIYIAGMSADVKPIFTTDLSDLEAAAEACCPRLRAGICSPGRARRRRASERAGAVRVADRPRMFIDRAERDLSTTVLGASMPAPVILGPVGRQAMAHPDGEIATARAAAGLEPPSPLVACEQSLEEVAVAAPNGPRWFGLDWLDGDGPTLLLTRARAAGAPTSCSPPRSPGRAGRRSRRTAGLGWADRPRRHPERAGRADRGSPWPRRHRRLDDAAPRSRCRWDDQCPAGSRMPSAASLPCCSARAPAQGPTSSGRWPGPTLSHLPPVRARLRSEGKTASAHAPNTPRRARNHPHHCWCRHHRDLDARRSSGRERRKELKAR